MRSRFFCIHDVLRAAVLIAANQVTGFKVDIIAAHLTCPLAAAAFVS